MSDKIIRVEIREPSQSPPSAADYPFDMLDACHERVQRMISLLQRLRERLSERGWDEEVAKACGDVIRYFDIAAPQHHMDEELHIFSKAFSVESDLLRDLVLSLKQEHKEMEAQWQLIRPELLQLRDANADNWQPLSEPTQVRIKRWVKMYEKHIEAEESLVFPACKPLLDDEALKLIGTEMIQRRMAN